MTAGPSEFEQQLRSTLGSGYDVTREIPGGGMSRVFLATEKSLDRQVVIKLLAPELAAGVNRERFQREIQLAAKLQHPHIVPLFSAGVMNDTLYYTMPFIAGESLKHALQAGTKFSVRDTVRILHDVTDALAHAHHSGIVHRDIKPANVLRSGGHAVVTDFGVAKALNMSRPGTAFTASGMVVGTPAYMAPEQLAGDPAADHRVDIYAVGLLGYELLAGSNPFSSPSPQQTLASQLTRVPEQLNVRHPDVPGSLAAVIARCLAKDPAQRPQSAAQLLAELDSLVSISGDAVAHRRGKLDRWTMGALGLGVVLTGVIAAVVLKGRAPSDEPPAAAAAPLTHKDSLDIARAVEAKLMSRRAAQTKKAADSTPPRPAVTAPADAPALASIAAAHQQQAMLDSLRSELMREVMDSVAKTRRTIIPPEMFSQFPQRGGRGSRDSQVVYRYGGPSAPPDTMPRGRPNNPNMLSPAAFEERAANMGPQRRVLVGMPHVGRTNAAAHDAAMALRDSIVMALKHDPRFVVIVGDTTVQISNSGRLSESDAQRLNADMAVVIAAVTLGNGNAQWQVVTRDLTAHGAYQQRLSSITVRMDSLTHGADSLVHLGMRALHDMDRAPRKAPTTMTISKDSAVKRQ